MTATGVTPEIVRDAFFIPNNKKGSTLFFQWRCFGWFRQLGHDTGGNFLRKEK
jgi:hypothetical protein